MKLLLIDDEDSVLELLKLNASTEWPAIKILTATNGREALKIIEAEQFKIPVVICDYSMPQMNAEELYKIIREKAPHIKFVLCTGRDISEIAEFKAHPPYFLIEKPRISEGIKKLSEKMMSNLLDSSEKKETIPDFLPVTLQILEKSGSCPCPLFLKLSDNKYIRIFQQDDPFTHNDLVKYQNKKVNTLFILRDDLGKFSKYLEDSLAHYLNVKSEGSVSDLGKMHAMGLQFFKLPFMTDEQIKLTENWIHHTQKFFTSTKNKSVANKIAEIMDKSSPRMINHLNLCAFFSIELAHTLTWTNETTLFKLTMASLLHDVALHHEDLEFSVEQINIRKSPLGFRQHPKDGASLIQMLKDVPPDVDRIIQEHHELPDGNGFPRGLKGNQVSPLSTIFILAHALAQKALESNSELGLEKKVLLAKIPTYFYDHSPWRELLKDYALS